MTDAERNCQGDEKPFTTEFAVVLETEREYLDERRRKNLLPGTGADPALWGLAISGGGVRSATFGLGVLQALIRKGLMKRFDYLSTVSGGGYIGSCLSSLLTGRDDTGLEDHNSPFTSLGDDLPDSATLSARHQMHHLRTHGEYIIPRSHLFSRDVQRAVGSIVSGMGHTLILFILILVASVALVHFGLSGLDRNLGTLAPRTSLTIPGEDQMGNLEYVKAMLYAWYSRRLAPPFRAALSGALGKPGLLAWMVGAGGAWCLIWIVVATIKSRSKELKSKLKQPDGRTPAGWTREEQWESWFIWLFNLSSLVLAIGLLFGISLWIRGWEDSDGFLGGLLIPLAMSIGGLIVGHVVTYGCESFFVRQEWRRCSNKNLESRFRRSLYASVRGACLYGLTAAIILPAILILLFSLSDLPLKFFISLAALVWAWASMRSAGGPSTIQLGGWLHRPLANLAVMVFLCFAFAEVSARLLAVYAMIHPQNLSTLSLLAAAAALALFFLLGYIIDANRVSPHYFYRDRLTEAYLKTDARTVRPKIERQGMPLTVLRDDEDLKLSELGKLNGRGPYHLIVTALNLRGSQELNRKSFLSEHFIFSRDYIGSRVTGWVKTNLYCRDTVRLARAMTISAAAVGSAMGYHTFGAQAFVATVTNARLGYWMDNPWFYKNKADVRFHDRLTCWPYWLTLEVLGLTSARQRLVNLSDGGHTGDNLGLLPLLLRRCSTIVISDAENDGNYAFGSFNNAVRMAFIEENIRIDIDLSSIMQRPETAAGYRLSQASVVEGTIHYPRTPAGNPESTGRLIYIKASVSGSGIPVHVTNYLKDHDAFPHETTADQFFDDAQFEAYRALGEHCGNMAAVKLRREES